MLLCGSSGGNPALMGRPVIGPAAPPVDVAFGQRAEEVAVLAAEWQEVLVTDGKRRVRRTQASTAWLCSAAARISVRREGRNRSE